MSGYTVAVHDKDNNFIAWLPRVRRLEWTEEHNAWGSGSLAVNLDDKLIQATPALLDYFNLIKVHDNNGPVGAFQVQSRQATPLSDDGRWVTLSGPGPMAVLHNAQVRPEYPLKRASSDERSFDYGSSSAGGWYVPSEWVTPVGIPWRTDVRYAYPSHWPDPSAQWLWSTSPDADSPYGWNWFRGGFTLPAPAYVQILAAGDNVLHLQLDGEEVITAGAGAWRGLRSKTAYLDAGFHLIAAAVLNTNYTTVPNLAGFICSVYEVDRNFKLIKKLKSSTPSSFSVKAYGSAPGWFGASILKKLVQEGAARGCRTLPAVTFGFTDTVDSDGVAWTGRQDRSFRIGVDTCLDVATKLIEDGLDLAMTPDLVLNAWKTRGSDLSATVTLRPTRDVKESDVSDSAPEASRALVRDKGGWSEVYDSTAETTYGRCETGFTIGTETSDAQAKRLAIQGLQEIGYPKVTVTVQLSGESGPLPGRDFGVADIVSSPGTDNVVAPHQVMAIGTSVDDETGEPTFTVQLYPEG